MKNIINSICIIPARGGSKRIPNKNIKFFSGKPIIQHVIDILKKSKLFKIIIISSDSEKILKIAKKNKCATHLRKKNLSDDYTTTTDVINNVIKDYQNKINFDKVFCVYPTSVFLKKNHITYALKKIKKTNNFIFSATSYSHPIQRSFYKSKINTIHMFDNRHSKTRTQDLKTYYHDAGQFYLGWKSSWLKKKPIFSGPNHFIELSELETHDFDFPKDWSIALKKWKFLKLKK